MSEESSEAKLARIDERTLNMEKKLDDFLQAAAKREADQDKKIDELMDWKNYLRGGLAILFALVGIHVHNNQP